jgi:NAD(P)-dependent dehydrogenase (short-subunit alcohol dehydrogenase family)
MTAEFDGKVALVTGSSSGIGRATALAFAERGAAVALASRRAAESEALARQIVEAGGRALFVQTDVSKSAEVKTLVARTVETFGGLDYAFNNAGIEGTAFVPVHEYSEDTWDEVIAINLTGVFHCMKHELPPILARKGAIVNMASVAGLTGTVMGAAYSASKHGVVGMTRSAAREYAPAGVRINAVAPAVIFTPMAERAFYQDPAIVEKVLSMHPLGRVGTPDEVANAVVWLCSDAASFVTGHALPIDGGLLA